MLPEVFGLSSNITQDQIKRYFFTVTELFFLNISYMYLCISWCVSVSSEGSDNRVFMSDDFDILMKSMNFCLC